MSNSFASINRKVTSTKNTGFVGVPKPVAPEDNWNLIANPSVYLDELPQPYKFINKCLDELIIKPVFAQISEIE